MPTSRFDCQSSLAGPTLYLEPLQAGDFGRLYEAASDPDIWAGHPAQDRHQKAEFERYFAALLATHKALVVYEAGSGRVIGSSSYYSAPDLPECIAIGFTFLIKEKWGGAYNFQLKQLMIEHALKHFPEVYFHIAPSNIRSQKATMKLGASFLHDAELNLSTAPALWKCYVLTDEAWRHAKAQSLPA